MTREIKFRVIKGNKIVGYEELREDGWYSMMLELNPENGERWGKFMFNFDGLKRCQYVGLKDKNGVETYEGDTIKIDRCECLGISADGSEEEWIDCTGEVMFEDGMFVFDGHSAGTLPMSAYKEDFTVIGNIYENPELLNP